MAYVYLARQEGFAGFEKECVIKRILPHLSEDQTFVHMFLDEARIAARLSHPNIVQIFDLGQVEGNHYLAMEYINGFDLSKLLQRAQERGTPAVPWPLVVRIIADAAAGLAHAHQATDAQGVPLGLVHRDISPTNIMVSRAGITKVLDFGIASAVTKDSRTTAGTIKGRLSYMSPEQLQGHALDGRADLFSLAVVCYELVYGTRPFAANGMGALTLQILQQEPIPPAAIADKIPARLRMILSRALSKRPEDRWQHMRVFQRALEQLLMEQHTDCTPYHVEAYLKQLFPETDHPLSVPSPPPATARTPSIAAPVIRHSQQKPATRSWQSTIQRHWSVFATAGVALATCGLLLWQHPWRAHSPKQPPLKNPMYTAPATSALPAAPLHTLSSPVRRPLPEGVPPSGHISVPVRPQPLAHPIPLRSTVSLQASAPPKPSKQLTPSQPKSTSTHPTTNTQRSPIDSPSPGEKPPEIEEAPATPRQPEPPPAVEPPLVEPPANAESPANAEPPPPASAPGDT